MIKGQYLSYCLLATRIDSLKGSCVRLGLLAWTGGALQRHNATDDASSLEPSHHNATSLLKSLDKMPASAFLDPLLF
jgi:hypothetical protein